MTLVYVVDGWIVRKFDDQKCDVINLQEDL